MQEISILTEYAKEQFDFIRWNKYVQKEIDVASDRALVLICCSVLDAQLEKLLKHFLLDGYKKKKESLFEPNGPLGSFSAKIDMGFFCGLISKHERDMIDTMRKIRNKFAHEIELNNLDDEAVKDLCRNLSIPDLMYVPEIIPCTDNEILKFDTDPFKDGKLRTRFITTFRYISRYLERRITNIKKRQEYHALNEIETLEKELEQLKQFFNRRQELAKKVQNMMDDEVPEHIRDNLEKVLEELSFDNELGLNCSEKQYMEYLQRILDTIKYSYGIL